MNEENRQYYDDEIDLMDVFSTLWKRKLVIAGVVALCLLLAVGWLTHGARSYTQQLVQLNFAGIDQHQYPDGTRFRMQDLIAQNILVAAAEAIDNAEHRQQFIENPRRFVFVDPFIPVEVKENMKRMERDKQTYIYLPNQFYVNFIEKRGGTYSHEEKKRLLLAINRAFEDKFINDFVKKKLLAINLGRDDIARFDYIDALEVLSLNAESYASFLGSVISDAGFYRSPLSGVSFQDLLNALNNIRQIDIHGITTILKTQLDTKQKDALLARYQYRIRSIDKEMEKKEQEARIARDLLQEIWTQERGRGPLRVQSDPSSSAQVLLDSTLLDRLSEKDYKSVLLQRALDTESSASALRVEKKYLKEDLAMLKAGGNESAGPAIELDYIEASIEKIRERLVSLAEAANTLNQEYLLTRYTNIIQVHKNPETFTLYLKSPLLVLALTLMVGLILGIFIALIVESASSRRQRQENVS